MKSIIRPLMIGLMVAAAYLIPAAAQEATPIPPEATEIPAPPPPRPEGVLFQAPGRCTVTPDERSVMSWGNGVFSLPDGLRRFDISYSDFDVQYSPDGQYFAVSGVGLQDAYTGEILIESADRAMYGMETFSPDGRLFVDGNTVYDLTTFEVVATLNRDRNESADYTFYSALWFINEGRWAVYEQPLDANLERTSLVFVDTTTWEPVIDTSGYLFGVGINFNHDYTRYGVGGFGVFEYPSGEKLFDLPEGYPRFSPDSSVVLMTPTFLLPRPANLTYTFLNGETGAQINQFEIPWDVSDVTYAHNYPLVNIEMSQVMIADTTQVGIGPGGALVIDDWRVIDVQTDAVIQNVKDVELDQARTALGLPNLTRPIINGRYAVQNEGIFDAETDQIILALNGNQLSLSPLGTYAVTQTPCTVWELP